jgi:hypothetical protein
MTKEEHVKEFRKLIKNSNKANDTLLFNYLEENVDDVDEDTEDALWDVVNEEE